eukprot:scaffold3898_cov102-Skeletonema_dohrnii-CCMP3373.AAC.3
MYILTEKTRQPTPTSESKHDDHHSSFSSLASAASASAALTTAAARGETKMTERGFFRAGLCGGVFLLCALIGTFFITGSLIGIGNSSSISSDAMVYGGKGDKQDDNVCPALLPMSNDCSTSGERETNLSMTYSYFFITDKDDAVDDVISCNEAKVHQALVRDMCPRAQEAQAKSKKIGNQKTKGSRIVVSIESLPKDIADGPCPDAILVQLGDDETCEQITGGLTLTLALTKALEGNQELNDKEAKKVRKELEILLKNLVKEMNPSLVLGLNKKELKEQQLMVKESVNQLTIEVLQKLISGEYKIGVDFTEGDGLTVLFVPATESPSDQPSLSPSESSSPSDQPSLSPSESSSPSDQPSLSPSESSSPSDQPSLSPSESLSPSDQPSLSPSESLSPSDQPSLSPSESLSPSDQPSLSPSESLSPSNQPSLSPSESLSPSDQPSLSPSESSSPSDQPSLSPSESLSPSDQPSLSPSESLSPSDQPSLSPSDQPSESRGTKIMNLLLSANVSSEDVLENGSTSQGKAFVWVTNDDTISPPLQPGTNDAQIIQRFVLAAFYYATGGDGWTNKEGWLRSETECGWFRVDCSGSGDMVTELLLNRNNLVGRIPTELNGLGSLEKLRLFSNKLTGTIPTELGGLGRLDEMTILTVVSEKRSSSKGFKSTKDWGERETASQGQGMGYGLCDYRFDA